MSSFVKTADLQGFRLVKDDIFGLHFIYNWYKLVIHKTKKYFPSLLDLESMK